jgi:hypothetical protein
MEIRINLDDDQVKSLMEDQDWTADFMGEITCKVYQVLLNDRILNKEYIHKQMTDYCAFLKDLRGILERKGIPERVYLDATAIPDYKVFMAVLMDAGVLNFVKELK